MCHWSIASSITTCSTPAHTSIRPCFTHFFKSFTSCTFILKTRYLIIPQIFQSTGLRPWLFGGHNSGVMNAWQVVHSAFVHGTASLQTLQTKIVRSWRNCDVIQGAVFTNKLHPLSAVPQSIYRIWCKNWWQLLPKYHSLPMLPLNIQFISGKVPFSSKVVCQLIVLL